MDRALSNREKLAALAVVGSLWGFSEVALNAGLRAVAPNLRAGVLVAVGMLLMGALLGVARRPSLLIAAAFIAAACRQLVVPILQVSLLCKANACIAVVLQGTMAAGVAAALGARIHARAATRGVGAATAALAAAGTFWVVGMHVAPCNYLLSFNRPDGLIAFLMREGVRWAVLSSVTFPVGYAWGVRRGEALGAAATPRLYYASSVALCAAAWIAAGLLTAAGY